MRLRFCPAVVMLVFLLSRPGRVEAQDQGQALLSVERATSELSSDSGFSVAMLRTIHSRAVLLWPGAPVVVGANDIGHLLGALPNLDSLRLTWQPLGVELARDSALGITWGITAATPRLTPGPPRMGRYITAWRRDAGRWAIAALLFLGITPLPAGALAQSPRRTQDLTKPSGAAAQFVAADLAFARLAGDSGAAVAFQRWAAPDAVIFGGGGVLIRGPEAIGQAIAGPATWQWHPVIAGAAQSRDLGWTVGEAVIAATDAEPTYSKYLTVWIRRPGGQIRFVMDGGNSRPPPP